MKGSLWKVGTRLATWYSVEQDIVYSLSNMSKDRVSRIDTDIEHVGRQKVIDYITKKYGSESVCRIVTFGTMAAKMAIKDVARVLGYPTGWANALAKMIPSDPKMTIDKAFSMNPELRKRYGSEADVARVIDVARVLEGNKRHSSLHACGLVISPGKVDNFLPTSIETDADTGEKGLASQVVMTEVEDLSLLKMDLLGLKNLTAIHEVINTIKKTRGINIQYQDIPLDDRETYQMLAKGLTGGVFQLESPNMTKLIMQMMADADTMPENQLEELFERLIAAVALYRPGPMDYIPDYISGMQNPQMVHYDCPEEEGILSSTYGVLVYQEQLLKLAQILAGYNLGAADLLRRACGKKKKKAMEAEHAIFVNGNEEQFKSGKAKAYIPGCLKNGISSEVAEEIWSKMEKFASYAFNRSHAACYAWIAEITAYMACHWPTEFYCAMINAFEDVGDKVKGYLALAAKRGIKILPPDINKSLDRCSVEGDSLRIGFRTLNHLNKFSKHIMKERKAHGPFKDYQDFFERMNDAGNRPNKSSLDSLIFSGCFDCFGLNKNQLKRLTSLLDVDYKQNAVNRALGQYSLFSAEEMRIVVPAVEEYHPQTLMDEEFKAIGFYLTRHPVDDLYAAVVADPSYKTVTDLAAQEDSENRIMTFGLIRNLKQLFTKRDDEMYVFSVEDRFNSVRCVLFPNRVAANKHRLQDGAVVKVIGEFVNEEEHGKQIIVQDLSSKDEVFKQESNFITVTVRSKAEQDALLAYVHQNPGDTGVRLLANGRTYPIARKIKLSPQVLDFLQTHFSKVSM